MDVRCNGSARFEAIHVLIAHKQLDGYQSGRDEIDCQPTSVKEYDGPEEDGHIMTVKREGRPIAQAVVGYHPKTERPRVLAIGNPMGEPEEIVFPFVDPAYCEHLDDQADQYLQGLAIAAEYGITKYVRGNKTLMKHMDKSGDWYKLYMNKVLNGRYGYIFRGDTDLKLINDVLKDYYFQ
jgi:hypothetical protein